ncbi:MAG: KAP family NTPase [Bacteroides sp.]|jgi:hypothetical protein|nr:KAP family NTPase [Bacteroides sp.]
MENLSESQSPILNPIMDYLKEKEPTNYAYMISGEWGSGKTYFLKNTLIAKMREWQYRPIYITLSGINDLNVLKELMLSRINIKAQSTHTLMDEEIELLRNVAGEQDLELRLNIPKNIVFCFDDFERIDPSFFEEALGFINSYIEHSQTKTIIVCDENRLSSNLNEKNPILAKKYSLIKEKYIRFTVEYRPNLCDILNSYPILKLDEEEKTLVKLVFDRGRCQNLRTLQYLLTSIDKILRDISRVVEILVVEDKYVSKLRRLVLFYTTFFAIEFKRGLYPFELLQKLQIPKRILSLEEQGIELDLEGDLSNEFPLQDENRPKKEEVYLVKLQKQYFENNNESFEPFDSIANYLKSGYFNVEAFQGEIDRIVLSLKRKEGTKEDSILKIINNFYSLSDDEYQDKIEEILLAVDEGEFSLGTYLQIYSQLLVLESYQIEGVVVDEDVSMRFKEAMKKSVESLKVVYDSSFLEHYTSLWQKNKSVQYRKYHALLDYAETLNKGIKEAVLASQNTVVVKKLYKLLKMVMPKCWMQNL